MERAEHKCCSSTILTHYNRSITFSWVVFRFIISHQNIQRYIFVLNVVWDFRCLFFTVFFFFLVDSLNKKSFLWSPWVNFCNKVAVLVLFGRGQRQTLPSQHSASKDRGAVVEEEVRKIDLTCCGTSPLLPPTPPLLFHLVHRTLVRYQSLVRPLPSLLPLPLLQRTHKHTEDINHTAAAALSDSLVTFSGVATVSLHRGS